MVRVRDDDVLMLNTPDPEADAKFRTIHEMIVSNGAHHVPAILCGPIQEFPDTIRYLLEEMDKGTVTPELHGWDHVSYEELTVTELEANLGQCVEWFNENLGVAPKIFYPPWGGVNPEIIAAAKLYGMKAIGTEGIIRPRAVMKSPNVYRGQQDTELFIHWWAGNEKLVPALKILNDIR